MNQAYTRNVLRRRRCTADRREEGGSLNLTFSSDKSGITVYNDEEGYPLKIKDILIEHVETNKYLGVWLNEGKQYLEEQEEKFERKEKMNAAIMKHRALYGIIYEVARGIWKGVVVSGLSFGSAVF